MKDRDWCGHGVMREPVGDLRGLCLALDCVLCRGLGLRSSEMCENLLGPHFTKIWVWTVVELDFGVLFW